MGVMICSRHRCNNIMCDTYIPGVGYICTDCQSEFKKYLQQEGINPVNDAQMVKALIAFRETEQGIYEQPEGITVNEFFSKYTG